MDRAPIPVAQAREAEQAAEDARTRRALLHMLEDLQRDQAALRQARHDWLGTVDSIADPLMVHDEELRVVRCNRAYATRAGLGFTEIIGRPYWECFPRRSGPLEACLLQIEIGASGVHETEIRLDTGEIFISRAYSVRDAAPGHVLHLFENVTEKRRIVEVLRSREADLARAQRVASLGSWSWEIATDTMTWSEEMFRIFGLDPGTPAPAHREQARLYTPESWQRRQAAVEATLADGSPYELDVELVRPDGATRWITSRGEAVRDANGRITALHGTALDISGRKRVEATLQEIAQRLTLATKSARMGIWDWDVVANRLVWDARMYELYGIAEEGFGGAFETWQRGLHPGDRERASAEVAAAVAGGRDFNTEFRVVWPNGEVRHIEAHAVVQRAGDGTARRMIGVNWDVTERKRAAEQQNFTNAVLATQQETSLDGMYVVDSAQKMVSCNRRFVEMWGIPDEIMRSRSDEAALNSVLSNFESPGEFLDSVQQLYANRDLKLHDELHLKGGRTFDRYSSPMIGADGTYYGRVFYFRDVTEQKRAERAIRESEGKFRAIFEGTVDGLVLMDIAARSIAFANAGLERLLGYGPGKLAGLPVRDIMEDATASASSAAFDQGARGELKFVPDLPLRKADGTTVYADATGTVIELAGRPHLLGSVRDATARRAGEQRLRAQLDELKRWQDLTLDREDRVVELKREVNALLAQLSQPPRYESGQ